ncbi:YbaB/EbfC family nucleoid-associated protein [Micromonospora musae]|uniref:YbaB/EbfC family DNA-binding protein n=1 Tax=Micromonospora musae TaxID=1894970 RepID=A0A3A9XTB0_9ACTN|nr:YbaB/EbfC family nucleoid-associated protein [Micromonospora musae]RKN23573.1 YbaB/EbfC family DNA-binding protein [Micromonospora musae]RKN27982.1 YbaB/EbfC family DNA-binding protein [Micromonospora musae]
MAEEADRSTNHPLRVRFDEIHGQYQRLRSGLDELRERLADLRVTERSADGRVTATVGARGEVITVELSSAVYGDRDAAALSRTITETVRRASTRANAATRELVAGYLPAGAGSMDFLRTGDFGALLDRADAVLGGGK